MKQVLLGIGSNIEPTTHLKAASQALRKLFDPIVFSSVYRSEAVGIENASDFLNACCLFQCNLDYDSLRKNLKQLEAEHGRIHKHKGWQSRTLDIDIILFDHRVMDQDLHQYRHVWVPAHELLDLPSQEPKKPILYPHPLLL